MIKICDAESVEILKGVISSGDIHMHIEYSPKQSISFLEKQMKGITSRELQQEFPSLGKTSWENILGNRLRSLEYMEYYRRNG